MNDTQPDLRSRLAFERTWVDGLARRLMGALGSVGFIIFTGVCVLGWMLYNSGVLGNQPFDKYPYHLLELVVAIAALLVSSIVLITQNREAHIAEVKQQLDLEVNVRTEHEVTKILKMLDRLHREVGIHRHDDELEEMKQTTDIAEIKEVIEEVIKNDDPN